MWVSVHVWAQLAGGACQNRGGGLQGPEQGRGAAEVRLHLSMVEHTTQAAAEESDGGVAGSVQHDGTQPGPCQGQRHLHRHAGQVHACAEGPC